MASQRRTGALVLVVLALLALVGVAVWLVLGDAGDGSGERVPEETPAPRTGPRTRPAPREPREERPREHVEDTTQPRDDGPPVEPDDIDDPEPTHAPVASLRTVEVHVVDENGSPVRDAHVRAFSMFGGMGVEPEDAQTDLEGHVTLRVTGTTNFRVRAWTADAAAVGERVTVSPDASLDVTLTLVPGRALTGRVLTELSVPIPGARVTLELPTDDPFGLRLVAESDEQGRVDLGTVATDQLEDPRTRVAAAAAGFVAQDGPLAEVLTPDGIVLRMARGQTVRGRCVATGAAPVAHVRVKMAGAVVNGSTSPLGHGTTSRDGVFELEGVPAAGGTLELFPPAHVVPPPIVVAPGTGEIDLGDVVLLDGQPVSGVVVDDQDRPVPSAAVHALEQETSREVRSTVTDAQGRFTLGHIGEGPHVVVAQPTDGAEWSARVSGRVRDVTAGTSGLRVVLSGGLTLLVSFEREADGEPVQVASAEVEVTRTDVESGRTVTAWAGPGMTSVRVTFESAGRYRVVVKVPGYQPATLEDIDILDDRATRIDALFRTLPE